MTTPNIPNLTSVGRSERLLRSHDETIAERFTAVAREKWDVHLGHEVARARSGGDGEVVLDLANGTVLRGDLLLVATGRVPNGDRLDLDRTGVPTHPDGRIVVDDQQRTPVDGIFALGDASSPHQLKHVANHESKVVAHNLLHPDAPRRTDHRFVPSAVFSDPQMAAVGLTDPDAWISGYDLVRQLLIGATRGVLVALAIHALLWHVTAIRARSRRSRPIPGRRAG